MRLSLIGIAVLATAAVIASAATASIKPQAVTLTCSKVVTTSTTKTVKVWVKSLTSKPLWGIFGVGHTNSDTDVGNLPLQAHVSGEPGLKFVGDGKISFIYLGYLRPHSTATITAVYGPRAHGKLVIDFSWMEHGQSKFAAAFDYCPSVHL